MPGAGSEKQGVCFLYVLNNPSTSIQVAWGNRSIGMKRMRLEERICMTGPEEEGKTGVRNCRGGWDLLSREER